MFSMETRHLLNLSVQISENFNVKTFSEGACALLSLAKCAIHSPDGFRYKFRHQNYFTENFEAKWTKSFNIRAKIELK